LHFQPTEPPGTGTRGSPAFRQVETDRPYLAIESRPREASTMGSLETLPKNTPQPLSSDSGGQVATSSSPFFSNMTQNMAQGGREHPHSRVTANNSSSRSSSFNTTSFNTNGTFTSSSPVSSSDSGSQFAPAVITLWKPSSRLCPSFTTFWIASFVASIQPVRYNVILETSTAKSTYLLNVL
jgi:hypothetical protein